MEVRQQIKLNWERHTIAKRDAAVTALREAINACSEADVSIYAHEGFISSAVREDEDSVLLKE